MILFVVRKPYHPTTNSIMHHESCTCITDSTACIPCIHPSLTPQTTSDPSTWFSTLGPYNDTSICGGQHYHTSACGGQHYHTSTYDRQHSVDSKFKPSCIHTIQPTHATHINVIQSNIMAHALVTSNHNNTLIIFNFIYFIIS